MPLVVGVSFRRVGKVYYFDPGEIELHEGDFVIAETARGVEFGEVVLEPREVPEEELVAPLKNVVRVATGDDMEREASNRERERHAYEICERKIAEHGLPMKLLEAEYAFDGSQVTLSFSADGRVDFRELVKDVASALKTKVQLHQIGVRDEAKLIGGYGTCGRSLCCATFLSNFDPISMKMAKDQSLFLNPAKFSGVCGKLMCCLRYEHDYYKQAQKRLPSVGAILPLENGRGKVIDVNVISNVITLQTEDDVQVHIHAEQLNLQGLCRRHGLGCTMSESHCEPLRIDQDSVELTALDSIDNEIEDEIVEEAEQIVEEYLEPVFAEEAAAEEVAVVTQWRSPAEESAPSTEQAADGDGEQDPEKRSDKPKNGNGAKPNRYNHKGRGGHPKGHNGSHAPKRNDKKPKNKPGPEPAGGE